MTEGLFILTTIFVAYVVYQVVNDQKKTSKTPNQDLPSKVETVAAVKPQTQTVLKKEAPPAAKPQPVAKKEATPKTKPETVVKKDAPAPAKLAVSESKPAVATAPESAQAANKSGSGLRDPNSGEVVNTFTNYRFAKRWIKEALVTEGLLPKVYKNNELNDEVETQIKAALAKLEAMDKYRA